MTPTSSPGPNPALLAAAMGGNSPLSSMFTQAAQPLQDYYRSFFDPTNAGGV
jgi:hypothetical protein